jgi:hypothetical protein
MLPAIRSSIPPLQRNIQTHPAWETKQDWPAALKLAKESDDVRRYIEAIAIPDAKTEMAKQLYQVMELAGSNAMGALELAVQLTKLTGEDLATSLERLTENLAGRRVVGGESGVERPGPRLSPNEIRGSLQLIIQTQSHWNWEDWEINKGWPTALNLAKKSDVVRRYIEEIAIPDAKTVMGEQLYRVMKHASSNAMEALELAVKLTELTVEDLGRRL